MRVSVSSTTLHAVGCRSNLEERSVCLATLNMEAGSQQALSVGCIGCLQQAQKLS